MPQMKYLTFIKTLGATCLLAMSSSSFAISSFSDDFQGYGASPNFAPWECFSDNGGFEGGYYCGNPSTTGPQISALANDGMGNEFLNMYANYDNFNVHNRENCNPCSPNEQEAISIFYSQTFDAADTAGEDTWVFTFDFKEAGGGFGPSGATEAGAFIRVFDDVFNLLAEVTLDTTGSDMWQTGQLAITLDDAWLSGNFQIGFSNLVGNYENSGMNYDNVNLNVVPIPAAAWLFASGLGFLGWMRRGRS